MQHAIEASPPVKAAAVGWRFPSRRFAKRASFRPLTAIARAVEMAHRRREAAKELDHLLDLPDRIFRDIGVTRSEAYRARRRLRRRFFRTAGKGSEQIGDQG